MTTQQRITLTLGHLHKRLKEVQHQQRQIENAVLALQALARLDRIVRSPRSKGESIRSTRTKRTSATSTRTTGRTGGRRSMNAAQREEVSVRMKRYWAKRRAEQRLKRSTIKQLRKS
jgi:hypothetical protein